MKNILSSLKKAVLSAVKKEFFDAVPKKESYIIFDENLCPCYIRFDLGTKVEEKRLELLRRSSTLGAEQEMRIIRERQGATKNLRHMANETIKNCLGEAGFIVGEMNNGESVFENHEKGWKINVYIDQPSSNPDWFSISFTPASL